MHRVHSEIKACRLSCVLTACFLCGGFIVGERRPASFNKLRTVQAVSCYRYPINDTGVVFNKLRTVQAVNSYRYSFNVTSAAFNKLRTVQVVSCYRYPINVTGAVFIKLRTIQA